MKKVLLTLVAVAFLAVVTMAFAAQEVKEKFTIDVIKNTKGAVEFPHKKHSAEFKIECIKCHHTEKDNAADHKACPTCHLADKENDIAGVGKAPAIKQDAEGKKNLFHDKCKGCHKETTGPDGKNGPTKCKECHGGGDE